MYNLKIIIASTREGRKGHLIGKWIEDIARQHSDFDVEVLDLKEINLPFMDEPYLPYMQQYQHQHTIQWSKKIDEADAFIIVTPEYNFSFPASIKNALDFLYKEWEYKPVAFVSYGGISGGLRAVQALKLVVLTYKLVPILEGISIPSFTKLIQNENFIPNAPLLKNADMMLSELLKWTIALKPMRRNN